MESGVTTVNGKIAGPETIIKNGDRIEYVFYESRNSVLTLYRNIVHRHEPPVTSTPIKILHHDVEREFIVVDKPGSIVRPSYSSISLPSHSPIKQPIHGTGRYFKNTLIEILQDEFGFKTYRKFLGYPCDVHIILRTQLLIDSID